MRKTVVSTSLGAEGIPARHGGEILLADDAPSFAEQIRRALASEELRTGLGHAAEKLARERFDWSRIHGIVLNEYKTMFFHRRRQDCMRSRSAPGRVKSSVNDIESLQSEKRPLVLQVRGSNATGGGVEPLVLNAPRYLTKLGYDALCVYMHPPGDGPALAERAANAQAPFVSVADRGPLDLALLAELIPAVPQQKGRALARQ